MLKQLALQPKKYALVAVLVTLLLTSYQLMRIIAFVNVYGGVEHDGGWMLSISRSLAERGTYTTMVSTIFDPTVRGAVGVDDKFDIQADDGRIWFFTGNGIGPASIIPDALVIKLFGSSFWALRAGPLMFYTLFLLLAAYILYQLAGLGAVFLFHAYLFFYPHISIFLSYEAMGEVPSMFYILAAYLVFVLALRKSSRRWLYLFGAGLVVGVALNAKLITLWSLSGIFIWAGLLWLTALVRQGIKVNDPLPTKKALPLAEPDQIEVRQDKNSLFNRLCELPTLRKKSSLPCHFEEERREIPAESMGISPRFAGRNDMANIHNPLSFRELLGLGLGSILPTLLWEGVHLIILTRLMDFQGYVRHTEQRLRFILDDGSGVGLQIHAGAEFFWDKFFLLSEVAHPQRWVTALLFLTILAGGLFLGGMWRRQFEKQTLLVVIWLGWLMNTIWFVSLAKTGWPRHFWFGLVLALMLLSVISVELVRIGGWRGWRACPERSRRVGGPVLSEVEGLEDWTGGKWMRRFSSLVGIGVLLLIGWGFLSQPYVRGFFLPEEIVPYWREKQINNKYEASLPWIIIPTQAQAEVVNYIKQMPPEARVYYPSGHKNAEIPPQTGRLHYPLRRRDYLEPHPADIVLIGPSLISPWKDPVRRQDLLNLVEQQCPQPALKNDFYMICPIEANLAAGQQ